MRVDSHHHLWRYDPVAYDWIAPHQHQLQRDFLPDDLTPLLSAHRLDGAIAVQATQTIDETRWLLELAAAHPVMKGVVGWVPLIDPEVDAILDELRNARVTMVSREASEQTRSAAAPAGSVDERPVLKGVRHVLQAEADDRYMLRDDFNRGIARLRAHGLVYDILIFGRHLPHAAAFVDRHPDQPFVLDHIAKPAIASARFDQAWADGLKELARRPHVACKLSGVVTEVRETTWSPALIAPYMEIALEAFGADRILFGTDWPVCLLQCEYGTWVDAVTSFISSLSLDEQEAIMGNNAARIYQLDRTSLSSPPASSAATKR
jgi:L-fuconolactonase